MSVYMARIDMIAPLRAEALPSVKHVDMCHIHGETNDTW